MTTSRRRVAVATKVSKGNYKIKLPKQEQPRSSKTKVIDAVPVEIPVVGFALVNADGTLDASKPSQNIQVRRVSKGHYKVAFETRLAVRSVMVQPIRLPHSPRVFVRIQPLIPFWAASADFSLTAVFLTKTRGFPGDCSFTIMGITDGSVASKAPPKPSRKSK